MAIAATVGDEFPASFQLCRKGHWTKRTQQKRMRSFVWQPVGRGRVILSGGLNILSVAITFAVIVCTIGFGVGYLRWALAADLSARVAIVGLSF